MRPREVVFEREELFVSTFGLFSFVVGAERRFLPFVVVVSSSFPLFLFFLALLLFGFRKCFISKGNQLAMGTGISCHELVWLVVGAVVAVVVIPRCQLALMRTLMDKRENDEASKFRRLFTCIATWVVGFGT